MKRSRIFLGATTTLLAVAGIAAAKSHKFDGITRYYCTSVPTTSTTKVCLPYDIAPFEAGTGTSAKTAIWTLVRTGQANLKYTLYTNFTTTDPVCKITLNSANSCGHKLTFTSHE